MKLSLRKDEVFLFGEKLSLEISRGNFALVN